VQKGLSLYTLGFGAPAQLLPIGAIVHA